MRDPKNFNTITTPSSGGSFYIITASPKNHSQASYKQESDFGKICRVACARRVRYFSKIFGGPDPPLPGGHSINYNPTPILHRPAASHRFVVSRKVCDFLTRAHARACRRKFFLSRISRANDIPILNPKFAAQSTSGALATRGQKKKYPKIMRKPISTFYIYRLAGHSVKVGPLYPLPTFFFSLINID